MEERPEGIFPRDIWTLIVTFLGPGELKQLRETSSVLNNVVDEYISQIRKKDLTDFEGNPADRSLSNVQVLNEWERRTFELRLPEDMEAIIKKFDVHFRRASQKALRSEYLDLDKTLRNALEQIDGTTRNQFLSLEKRLNTRFQLETYVKFLLRQGRLTDASGTPLPKNSNVTDVIKRWLTPSDGLMWRPPQK